MRLALKIFLVSALVSVVLLGAVGWSLLAVKQLVTVNQQIATRSVPALQLEGALRESFARLVRLEVRTLVLRDRHYAAAWDQRATQTADDLQRLPAYLETREERAAHGLTLAAFAEYRQHVETERRLTSVKRDAVALTFAEGPARESVQRVEEALSQMTTATEAALARSQAHARQLEAWTWHAVTAALLASVALGLAASALLAVCMSRALGRVSAATAALASGTWTGPLVEGRDEIGALAGSFNRMAERLREVDRLKEDFFSQISHDLRNPLASIRLAAEALQERARGASDADQVRMVQLINLGAVRMLGLVNEILDFTRLRANAMPLDRQPIDMLKTVGRALDEMHPLAEEKRVRLDLTAEEGDFTALADEGSLVRVVINLVANAIGFTPEGGTVTLRLGQVGDQFDLQVRDTGVGIPPEALPWIFEPYRQAHGRRKGTGLGLAVVKGLVEAHGGQVRVESEPGRGTCFTVTIPKTDAAS